VSAKSSRGESQHRRKQQNGWPQPATFNERKAVLDSGLDSIRLVREMVNCVQADGR
jgi:hypothetical protein